MRSKAIFAFYSLLRQDFPSPHSEGLLLEGNSIIPYLTPFATLLAPKTLGLLQSPLTPSLQGDVPGYVKFKGFAGQHLNTRIAPGDNDRASIGAAILILNRSSFAEGLLTDPSAPRSGDLCLPQSKLEP